MARFIRYQTGRAFLNPTKETFDGIEEAIRWAEFETPQRIRSGMNELVFHMAVLNQGIAREMSFGPLDPTGSTTALAWKIPVRRITGTYYISWKVRQIKPAVWQLYNDSREAYFIEFGINWLGAGRRVRRPIRKLSLRRTLEKMMTTQAYHRVWADMYSSPRHRHRGMGFYQIVQSPGGHQSWQDVSEHVAMSEIRRNARNGFFSPNVRRVGSRFQIYRAARNGGSEYGAPSSPNLGRRLP